MRIIAGRFKGRRLLPPPPRANTRPFTGRARESLLATLGPALDEACVLDLYCGTGTMGLEALSRGARLCYFAEKEPAVVKRLKRNIEAVGADDQSVIWQGDVIRNLAGWLSDMACDVDAAFVDPPYADSRVWDWQKVEASIFAPLGMRLANKGVVVLRTSARVIVPETPGPLAKSSAKRYGDMVVTIFRRCG